MTYELFIERRAQRQLSHIARPHQDRIIDAIRRLANDPRPAGVKKLTNREGWRIRVGNFRVIYDRSFRDIAIHLSQLVGMKPKSEHFAVPLIIIDHYA